MTVVVTGAMTGSLEPLSRKSAMVMTIPDVWVIHGHPQTRAGPVRGQVKRSNASRAYEGSRARPSVSSQRRAAVTFTLHCRSAR